MSFERYRDALIHAVSVHDPRLLMAKSGAIEVRYAPFDHVNRNAKLIILGITPGEQQANAAIVEAGRALRGGASEDDVLSRAKAHASFAGPMRSNLVAMLDAIGANRALGIASCASLWGEHVNLVQFTSALRYPVFKDGENYAGSSPKMTVSPLLRAHLLTYAAFELESLTGALVLPLGPAVMEACRYLVKLGQLDPDRVIEGVPHPSGANAERIAYFLGRKEKNSLSRKTDPVKIEAGREVAQLTVRKWGAVL